MTTETKTPRWPNFLIVGAPRAGTTSLYHHLRGHPDIFMPTIKEPHFFAQADMAEDEETPILKSLGEFRDEDKYLSLFEKAGTKPAVGEASVGYLYDESTPMRIQQKVPKAKIIILLREPVERAYSHYLLYNASTPQRKPFYEALLEDYARPRKVLGFSYLYVEHGLYYKQVKRYLDTLGPGQVRIYLYDDLKSDAYGMVRDVCTFLGVSFYDGRFFNPSQAYNTSPAPRNAVFKWAVGNRLLRDLALAVVPRHWRATVRDRVFLVNGSKPPITPEALEFLRPIFRDDILKLQGLIGRDLASWLVESK